MINSFVYRILINSWQGVNAHVCAQVHCLIPVVLLIWLVQISFSPHSKTHSFSHLFPSNPALHSHLNSSLPFESEQYSVFTPIFSKLIPNLCTIMIFSKNHCYQFLTRHKSTSFFTKIVNVCITFITATIPCSTVSTASTVDSFTYVLANISNFDQTCIAFCIMKSYNDSDNSTYNDLLRWMRIIIYVA